MDAKFQASFIPKQPLNSEERGVSNHVSIFSLISIILLILTIGIGGAAAIAEYMLDKRVGELGEELVKAKASFELSTIEELKKVSLRLNEANTLVEKHIAFSEFFELLNQSTYENVSFSGMDYFADDSTLKIKMIGLASSFNSLAIQSDLFSRITVFSDQVFDDFKLDENGNIEFTFAAIVSPSLASYKDSISQQQ